LQSGLLFGHIPAPNPDESGKKSTQQNDRRNCQHHVKSSEINCKNSHKMTGCELLS